MNTLELIHIESGQTPVKWVAVVQVITEQCICHQNGTFLSEKPNASEILQLSKTFADIVDLSREGKIGIKYDTKVWENFTEY